MHHDRIHAREPSVDPDEWRTGTIDAIVERDGHCVVTVTTGDGDSVDLVVTLAIRDLVVRRLPIETGESPVGRTVWFRKRGE